MMLNGRTVLLVEDDILILQDLKASLTRVGAAVTTASSVVTGLIAANRSFDVAILDIRLDELDVIPIAEKLNQKDVPIIFHSAVSERHDVVSAFPKAKSLSKPVCEAMLIEAVVESVKGN